MLVSGVGEYGGCIWVFWEGVSLLFASYYVLFSDFFNGLILDDFDF